MIKETTATLIESEVSKYLRLASIEQGKVPVNVMRCLKPDEIPIPTYAIQFKSAYRNLRVAMAERYLVAMLLDGKRTGDVRYINACNEIVVKHPTVLKRGMNELKDLATTRDLQDVFYKCLLNKEEDLKPLPDVDWGIRGHLLNFVVAIRCLIQLEDRVDDKRFAKMQDDLLKQCQWLCRASARTILYGEDDNYTDAVFYAIRFAPIPDRLQLMAYYLSRFARFSRRDFEKAVEKRCDDTIACGEVGELDVYCYNIVREYLLGEFELDSDSIERLDNLLTTVIVE